MKSVHSMYLEEKAKVAEIEARIKYEQRVAEAKRRVAAAECAAKQV